MKYLFRSFLYCAATILFSVLTIRIFPSIVEALNITKNNINNFGIRDGLILTIFIFGWLVSVSYTIVGVIQTIWNIILFHYYGVFRKPNRKEICLEVDNNNIIRDSYIVLSNGDKIPIRLKRINISDNDMEEVKEAESGE